MESQSEKSLSWPHRTVILLYDLLGRILWISRTERPYSPADVLGRYPWDFLTGFDAMACQRAILLCSATQQPTTFDGRTPLGLWRTWLLPCDFPPVRMLGIAEPCPDEVFRLTPRQREICRYLAEGLLSKQIAARLGITRATVDNHRAQIASRLGISSPQLVAWSAQHRHWFQ